MQRSHDVFWLAALFLVIGVLAVAALLHAEPSRQPASGPTAPIGTLMFVLPVTHEELSRDILNARRWKDFFVVVNRITGDPGDMHWAAYYAGQEEHATRLYNELFQRMGFTPPPITRPLPKAEPPPTPPNNQF